MTVDDLALCGRWYYDAPEVVGQVKGQAPWFSDQTYLRVKSVCPFPETVSLQDVTLP